MLNYKCWTLYSFHFVISLIVSGMSCTQLYSVEFLFTIILWGKCYLFLVISNRCENVEYLYHCRLNWTCMYVGNIFDLYIIYNVHIFFDR